jgi:D-cysteine desulfhydrase
MPYETHLVRLAQATADYTGLNQEMTTADCALNGDYAGAGYGVVGDLEREAIRVMARQEGILLDPVYTGRAFGGLLDLIRRQVIGRDETVLFWHTGGAPALFAYAEDLTDP